MECVFFRFSLLILGEYITNLEVYDETSQT